MSSYNLKAKSRHTAEIRDFIAIDMQYDYIYETPDGLIVYTSNEFNDLYEVIDDTPYSCHLQVGTFGCACSKCKEHMIELYYKTFPDTPIEKGWRERLKDLPRKTINGCWYVELGSCESLFSLVEAEAYKRGQAYAYDRCIWEIRTKRMPKHPSLRWSDVHHDATEDIAQVIEQLSSKIGNTD